MIFAHVVAERNLKNVAVVKVYLIKIYVHSREVFLTKAPRLFLCQNGGETYAIYPAGGGGEGP